MRVIVHKKDLEITNALSDFIEKKLVAPLQKRLKSFSASSLPMLDLEIGRLTRHHRKGDVYYVEGNLNINGNVLRAEATDQDIHTACDLLKDELIREITKFKDKQGTVSKKAGRKIKQEKEEF